ncbi:uncharacterized protein TM35_000092080 [Trypanosoma theileri]|uniref:Uncharacterized protein n=1 Tax=Trypanosoma theileri TaxID=67003 RepID=A0A1X0P035_9TRYP|nr:uncharacterized protein TM35_000092080 [Trypanosoma theileri]ORC90158.1 hypothetical protein TM35_000092080 [Trypanosoma theileri]
MKREASVAPPFPESCRLKFVPSGCPNSVPGKARVFFPSVKGSFVFGLPCFWFHGVSVFAWKRKKDFVTAKGMVRYVVRGPFDIESCPRNVVWDRELEMAAVRGQKPLR